MSLTPKNQVCGKCGTPNPPDAIICEGCGAVLAAYASPIESISTPDSNVIEPVVDQAEKVRIKDPGTSERDLAGGQQQDWRDLFTRQSPQTVDPDPSPPYQNVPPARANRAEPAKRHDRVSEQRKTQRAADQPRESDKHEPLPASVAAMRRRAETQPESATPRNAPSANRPDQPGTSKRTTAESMPSHVSPRSNVTRRFSNQRLLTYGLALMIGSCVLVGVAAQFSRIDAIAVFALFCLFPIGMIALILGVVRSIRSTAKDDRNQTRSSSR